MRTVVLLPVVLGLTGCAAVLGTKQKDFSLNSAPPGAEVFLNGNRLGKTPVSVKLSNQASHTFVFRREGYQEATCTLNRGTDAGWVILDVLTGLVPVIIDAATGSWSQTKGEGCTQAMDPITGPSRVNTPAPVAGGRQPNGESTTRPPALMDDFPEGTRWVANARTKVYHPAGCPIVASIPRTDRLYYGSEASLEGAGFTKSEECDATLEETSAGEEEPAPPNTPAPNTAPAEPADTVSVMPTPARTAIAAPRVERSRSGFWFNVGGGFGSLGCQDCSGRQGAVSGGLALGGTLSQKVALGVGTNGWTDSEDGGRLTVGTLTALIRFYPSSKGGFFLLGGLGLGSIRVGAEGFGSATETGFGALLGLGYDIRVGKSVSLTPFWNGFAVQGSDVDANVGQIGLGLTVN